MSQQILEKRIRITSIAWALIIFLTGSYTWSQPSCRSLFTIELLSAYDTSTLEPNDPSSLSQRIAQLSEKIQKDPTVYEKLTVRHDPELETIRVRVADSEMAKGLGVREGTEAYFVFLPGIGGENSYLTSVLTNVGSYNKSKLSSTLKKVKAQGTFVTTTAEGIEGAGRTGSVDINKIVTASELVAHYENIILKIKEDMGVDVPLILLGRSGYGTFSWLLQSQLNKKYGPNFIAGTVAINPVLADASSLKASEEALIRSDATSADNGFSYKELDRWSYNIYWEMARDPELFNPKKETENRLVLLSEKDNQIVNEEIHAYKSIDETNGDNFKVRIFDTDKHDILTLAPDAIRLEANLELFSFVQDVIKRYRAGH
ncbi:MAG: hypothetical protein R2827_10035 [Bdellovibrionales bacterium]